MKRSRARSTPHPLRENCVASIKGMVSMALHERDPIRDQMTDCVFAGRDLTRPVPKYTFPRDESLPRDAYQAGGR